MYQDNTLGLRCGSSSEYDSDSKASQTVEEMSQSRGGTDFSWGAHFAPQH